MHTFAAIQNIIWYNMYMITNWIVSYFSDIQMEKEAAEMDPADLL